MIAVRPNFNERGNEFFQWLPEDATRLIVTYLGREGEGSPSRSSLQEDRAVLNAAGICKAWQCDLVLRHACDWAVARLRHVDLFRTATQELSEKIERQFPPQMVELFQRHGIHIGKLPILKVGLYGGWEAERGDLSPRKMTSPVMRFSNKDGVGIVLHLQEQEERIVLDPERELPLESTLAIYRTFTASSFAARCGQWHFAWRKGVMRYGFYHHERRGLKAHLQALLADGPSLSLNHAFLAQTLSGQGRDRLYSPANQTDSRYRIVAFTHRYPQVALLAIELAVIAGLALAYVAIMSRRLLEMEIAIP